MTQNLYGSYQVLREASFHHDIPVFNMIHSVQGFSYKQILERMEYYIPQFFNKLSHYKDTTEARAALLIAVEKRHLKQLQI
jgi:hypothetical protein